MSPKLKIIGLLSLPFIFFGSKQINERTLVFGNMPTQNENQQAYEIITENRLGEKIYQIVCVYNHFVNEQYGFRPTSIIQVFYIDKGKNKLVIKKPLSMRDDGFMPIDRYVGDKELVGKFYKENGNTFFNSENDIYEFSIDKVNPYQGNKDLYERAKLTTQYSVKSSKKVTEYKVDRIRVLIKDAIYITNFPITQVDPY